MKKRIGPVIGILIILILFIAYWFYNNSYVLLKPVLTKPTGEPIIVGYTDEMIKNFPDVLKHYNVEYKINDSGHFLIKAKYMRDRDYILSITECALDSNMMHEIRKLN
ncbi:MULTISPECIES: hypothetical protein [unclassified Chitinophaga]|uniref:hypothetical protein n=1 Tax=unclassified Chitinophaga TaxID=2619133 RepID=UPI0009D2BA62|nr:MULTISPECIES: hypothetical protein [unclassified Chitinophaga]OMP75569.1 hypothetical protein BW716_29405 [[Flexibacter] sp. ATCC 35208]WPV64558.1 hypothetical protein QQL36_22395 [Chitinophaga sp. LS1]